MLELADLSKLVRDGGVYVGLRLDHKRLLTHEQIRAAISNMTVYQMVQLCNTLDLKLLYFHLTGNEPSSVGMTKYNLATRVWCLAKQ